MRTSTLTKTHNGSSAERQIVKLVRRKGLLRARDLRPLAIPRRHLTRLVAEGVLLRSGRGIYALADAAASEHRSLAEVCAQGSGRSRLSPVGASLSQPNDAKPVGSMAGDHSGKSKAAYRPSAASHRSILWTGVS